MTDGAVKASLGRLGLVEDSQDSLEGAVVIEDEIGCLVLKDDVAGDGDAERRALAERLSGEEEPLGEGATLVVAEQGGVIAVVGDEPHPPV